MTGTLQQRVTQILRSPRTEWPVIAAETETVPDLYRQYISILAAVGPLTLVLRHPSAGSFVGAAVQYVMQLAAMLVCARVIAWLAPRFRSTGETGQTLKLVAYANTPSWVAGVAHLVPWVAPLVLFVAGLYAIYLYYLGLSPVLKTPTDQVVPLMLVSAIVIIAVTMVLSVLVSTVVGGSMFVLI